MAEFIPTAEQQKICSAFLDGKNLMIQAYAGCSKTTTMAYIAKQHSLKFGTNKLKLAIAFNRRAKGIWSRSCANTKTGRL